MYDIIINPAAGRGRAVQYQKALTTHINDRGVFARIHVTGGAMDGYSFAREICSGSSEGIIGIGGDGTFQEIIAGMVDAFPHGEKIPIPLGIFPGGSGNDFIMTQLSNKKNALKKYRVSIAEAIKSFWADVENGHKKPTDVITANGMAYLNIGNIGLDAKIVERAANLKQKYGGRAYLAAVYGSIVRHKNIPLTIEANDTVMEGKFTLVAACNGRYYGGGLHIAPMAEINDGLITLCLVDAMSRPKTMALFPSLMVERHTCLKEFSFINCKEFKMILPPGKHTLCLDGNLYPHDNEIIFKMLQSVIDIFGAVEKT